MNSKQWFEVRQLPNNVFAIMEPHHFQEVISYLILGEKAALLFDTGAGIANIAEVVNEIWDEDIVVVNSHGHFDHIGDNHRFNNVLAHPAAINRIKQGYSPAQLAPHSKTELFAPGYLGDFNPATYAILPSNPTPVEDGHIIDLGGREITVMYTPGHSPCSIVLFDAAAGALFTGDSYYPGHLYAHYQGEFYGESCLADYANSMARLNKLVVKIIHPGHNNPVADVADLQKAAAAILALHEGRATCRIPLVGDLSIASLPNHGEEVKGYVIPDELFVYDIDGIKIIASK